MLLQFSNISSNTSSLKFNKWNLSILFPVNSMPMGVFFDGPLISFCDNRRFRLPNPINWSILFNAIGSAFTSISTSCKESAISWPWMSAKRPAGIKSNTTKMKSHPKHKSIVYFAKWAISHARPLQYNSLLFFENSHCSSRAIFSSPIQIHNVWTRFLHTKNTISSSTQPKSKCHEEML